MQIVILGAGYAGLRVALDLDKMLGELRLPAEIDLVDQNPYHQLIQLLHLTATTGTVDSRVVIDLKQILSSNRIRFVRGQVRAITPLARTVTLANGQTLDYDRLVITLGAETNYYNIPGAREHTLPLRNVAQALALREHLQRQFRAGAVAADPREQRISLTTAVVGGGYTGCQFAGELAAWTYELCEATGAPRREVRIALLDRSPYILSQFGTWASREAVRQLEHLGVSVYLNTAVEAVEPRLLRLDGKRVLRAGTIVWAAGIRAPALFAEAGLVVDDIGRIVVDRYLRARGQAFIFAAGDCARVPDTVGGKAIPATASYATRQGEHLAEALIAELQGHAPRSYEPLRLGELVSLGPKYAVGNPLGVPVFGYPAVLLKKGVEQYYRNSIGVSE